MFIPKRIIDNSEITLASFINKAIEEGGNLDLATAFFEVKAYKLVRESFTRLSRLRLLLGKAPELSPKRTLDEEITRRLKEELETLPLTKKDEEVVKELIHFLEKPGIAVKLYEKDFLHGKAYIFDRLVVVGSSNFTTAGFTKNTELNLVGLEDEAQYVREKWFSRLWAEARDFKEELIEELKRSRFGFKEYTPYQVFIKCLYELYREELEEMLKWGVDGGWHPPSKVDLAEFQEDAVRRALSRLKKYGGVLIADSVGLGKTWIAKKIIEEYGFYQRRRFLLIIPAQLREMWERELKEINLPSPILSQEELAYPDFERRAKKAIGGNLAEISLVVVDESHNFRNPYANRYENLFSLLEIIGNENKEKPNTVFLTATPINNTPWDLYWQLNLLLQNERAFAHEGIENLFLFFKEEIDKKQNLAALGDVLNEISIRRTRDYIRRNYPEAEIKGEKVIFPERVLENIEYELDAAYQGMYREIADTITEKLSMASYRVLEYKKEEKISPEEKDAIQRMGALVGIFRTVLLKRLESSVEAFRRSIASQIEFLKKHKDYLKGGRYLTKDYFNRYIVNLDEEKMEELEEKLEPIELADYDSKRLFADIDKDINLLSDILNRIGGITPEKDAKLVTLKRKLNQLLGEGQVVLFTYYADTLRYLFRDLSLSPDFKNVPLEAISGDTPPKKRAKIVDDFMQGKVKLLISTDVLSEGMNLQKAKFVVNYDLHWNPTRMIQRAGRIDRIGSPYPEIYVYNFFPEKELEELIRLVEILQGKIRKIDEAVGLDQKILGEKIHPKVFGVLRRIREKDATVLDELEETIYGGGESFYQPLREYLKEHPPEGIAELPNGIHSGLRRGVRGIFFYYQYRTETETHHLWYLYDLAKERFIKLKSEILSYISCSPEELRVIPNFFDKVYEVDQKVREDIEAIYRRAELEAKRLIPSELPREVKRIKDILAIEVDEYLKQFPADEALSEEWEEMRKKLFTIRWTKQRVRILRRFLREYKRTNKFQRLFSEVRKFVFSLPASKEELTIRFNPEKLRLIAIDFIS